MNLHLYQKHHQLLEQMLQLHQQLETPSTPAVAPTVAGTNKDNTYQAPAAKAEDKKELPNTGGKDNVAIASLGFLGLLLGALPFVKRKN